VSCRRLLFPCLLCAFAPRAGAFTIEVGDIAGLEDVEIRATALDRAAVLQLVNHDDSAVECELHFDSGPEEAVRRIRLPPLSSKILRQNIRPDSQRVRVWGSCV
jgi:hypothetical protein